MTYSEDLTLVIPTFERQELVLVAMSYWGDLGIELHVIDGSEEPIPSARLPKNEKIHYHHMPASLFDRLNYATELVQTPYCSLVADDEFFLPSGLEACIAELSKDPNLVACGGRALAFDATSDPIIGRPIYPEMAGRNINQKKPTERLNAHLGDYWPSTIYAVTRADVWKKALHASTAKSFPVFALPELRFEASIAYQGPSKVIPVLSWLRNIGQPPTRGQDETLDVRNTFHGWWHDISKDDQRREFLCILAEHLEPEATPENKIRIEHDLHQAFTSYDRTIQARKEKRKKKKETIKPNQIGVKKSEKKTEFLKKVRRLLRKLGISQILWPNSDKPAQASNLRTSPKTQNVKQPQRKDIFLAAKELRAEGVFVNLNEIEKVSKLLQKKSDIA